MNGSIHFKIWWEGKLKGKETLSLERRLIWLHFFVGVLDLFHLHQFWKLNSGSFCSHSCPATWFWFGGGLRNVIQDAQDTMGCILLFFGGGGLHIVYEMSDPGREFILTSRASVSMSGWVSAGELAPIWTGIKNSCMWLSGWLISIRNTLLQKPKQMKDSFKGWLGS